MKEIPQQVSESVRRRNPHLYDQLISDVNTATAYEYPEVIKAIIPPKPRRIRQSTKPLMNKLEKRWLDYEGAKFHEPILVQATGFRLGNGVIYWPDFVSSSFSHGWEIKGRQPLQDDSVVKIKLAARLFPQIKWRLAWEFNGEWQYQIVLP